MNRFAFAALTLALPTLVACSGSSNQESQLSAHGPVVEHPEWVTRGSGAFGGETRVIYAVGAKSGIKNPALLRSAAGNQARAEMQKIFETYTASLMKDYAASTTAGDFSASSEEQHVEQAVKTFAAGTLNGVEIVEQWIHPVDGTFYALARLDFEKFMGMLDQSKELNAKVKERVKRAAEKSFAELEREEAKHADGM
ncbi:MAG: LPP20 family lipoprotein [Deltaproteobacteria bacterium]|jgi:hypothetical protein